MSYIHKQVARIKNSVRGENEWRDFADQVRARQDTLLVCLDKFQDAILVSGCQRSGSTMMARIITRSDGMAMYRFGKDDELDAARILAGAVPLQPAGRYCFQTTYLNERYPEYFEHHNGFKLIWMLRNPESVVYSMVYHWSDFALNELFCACGIPHLGGEDKLRYSRTGLRGISPVRRAALAYTGKVAQLFELVPSLGAEKIMVVEYDDLVEAPGRYLPRIYEHVGVPYRREYAAGIGRESLGKRRQLDTGERSVIRSICEDTYLRARAFATSPEHDLRDCAHRLSA